MTGLAVSGLCAARSRAVWNHPPRDPCIGPTAPPPSDLAMCREELVGYVWPLCFTQSVCPFPKKVPLDVEEVARTEHGLGGSEAQWPGVHVLCVLEDIDMPPSQMGAAGGIGCRCSRLGCADLLG